MTKDEFEVALRRWGWVYGERPERGELPEHVKAPAVHPIARAMEFGHRTVNKRLDVAYRRKVLPGERSWSRDPIRCTETRTVFGTPPPAPAKDDPAPVIQAAWLELYALDMRVAGVVRLEYQVREGQREKAKQIGIPRPRYREMLAEGKGWMFARVTVLKAA